MKASVLTLAQLTVRQRSVALLCILISFLLLSPSIITQSSTHYLGGSGGDTSIYIWLCNLFPYQVMPNTWFETNGFFPYSQSLAFSDNWILPSLVFFLLKNIGIGKILCWNIVFITALIFLGYFSFLLLFSLTENFYLSIFFGILTPQLAPIQAHFGHPQMLHLWIVPVTIYLFLKWVSKQQYRYPFLIGISLFCSFLCSIYLTFFSGILFILLSLWWIARLNSENKTTLISRFFTCFIAGLLPTIPFLLPYLDVLKAFGERGYWEPHAFQATLASYLSFGSFNFLYSKIFSFSHSEASLGTGLLIPLLTFISFYSCANHKKIIAFKYSFVALFSLFLVSTLFPDFNWTVISIISWLTLISLVLLIVATVRLVKTTGRATSISNQELFLLLFVVAFIFMVVSFGPISRPDIASYSPYYFLYNLIPGFSGFRAISRAGIVSIYIFSLIAFYWLALFQAKKKNLAFTVLCSAMIVLENISAVFPFEPSTNLLSIKNSLDQLKRDSIGILLPYGDPESNDGEIKSFFNFATMQNQFLLWSVDNDVKSINGFTGIKTRLVKDLPQKLSHFPDDVSLNTLSEIIDLNTIILSPSFTVDTKRFQSEDLNLYKDYLSDAVTYEDGSIQLNFHPRIKVSNETVSSLIVQSTAKKVICKMNKPIQEASSMNAILAHTLENIPKVITDDTIEFTLPNATKTVPFVTIKLKSSLAEEIILNDCRSRI